MSAMGTVLGILGPPRHNHVRIGHQPEHITIMLPVFQCHGIAMEMGCVVCVVNMISRVRKITYKS